MTKLFFYAALCGIACLAANAADVEALKQQIIAQARTVGADDYAFTRTVRSEQIESDKTQRRVLVDRFDPTKPATERWTLVSIDGRAPSTDEQKAFGKETVARKASSYGRMAGYLSAPTTSGLDSEGRTVLKIAKLPKETVTISGSDLSDSTAAELHVDTSAAVPFVDHVRFTLTKPTRLKLVAKVEQFVSDAHYRLMPDGKPVPANYTSDAFGSLLGKSGHIRTTTTFSEVRAVGANRG